MIHNDHLGTPQKMTDSSGTVVWSADYKPFGEATITVSTITNNLRFPGQYFDAETGLNYNYYRDYNPAIGRYVEADPIGLRGGTNLFVYVEGNPVLMTDILGLIDTFSCQLNLSEGRMICTYYGMTSHNSSGWVSGLGGACQNNPSRACVSQQNVGAIPPGRYISTGPPSHRPTNTTRRNLRPDPFTNVYGRGTPEDPFQTHFCKDPANCSRGCIAQPDWNTMLNFNLLLTINPNAPITVVP